AAEREMMGGYRWNQLLALEPIIQKGLAVRVEDRWRSAAEMEEALAEALPPASAQDVGAWLRALGKDFLEGREKMIAAEEASWRRGAPPTSTRATSQPGRTSRAGILSGSMIQLQKKSTKVAIGALAALLFAISIVIVMRSSHNTDVAAATVPPAQVAPQPAVAQPAVVPPAPAPAPVVHDATVAREPARAATRDEKPSAAPTPRPRAIVRIAKQAPPMRQIAQKTVAKKEPPPAPVAAAAAAAKDDCNPPYYFEGRKKIFKPACL
ncbi:MAG TPA: hypothetical protein VLT45_01085, partial [Kofleriaceae bacterium]|nr:hypothetical protein [Kofleriaceae bacterium]